jgi:eukaryotic-like serine/threonine-protein kinase
MTPERWKQVREVLEAALDVSSKERAALLDDACMGDPALKQEVEELLAAYEEDFLEHTPLDEINRQLTKEPSLEGQFIGPYKIIRELGQGGMGAVFLALRADDQYKKRVAIKLVKRGMDTDYVLSRFRHERQILASLDHPNIARFLDGGATENGLPYFVMEYIEGQPIDKYCDENRLTTIERLKLFQTVCSAVYYAHQNLVVHRDLKPSNIIVTAEGTPKLMDFGIAKLLNPNLYAQTLVPTALTQRLMTPDYASPEQVKGRSITTASDVYSLGVLLYELLTGHRPYQFKSYTQEEIERVICEEQPEKPSTAIGRVETTPSPEGATQIMITPEQVSLTREGQPDKLKKKLAGDLDNIVLMAMRKEPLRRYASVEQFSEDIRRHLEGLPCIARKDTFAYRAGKFALRNKIAVAVVAAFIILVVASAVVILNQSIRAARERDKAKQVSAFLVELFNVSDPGEARGNMITAREILDKGAQRIERELADQPEVQATLMSTIGQVYVKLGLYEAALPLYEKALQTRLETAGEESVEYAESLNYLGVLYNAKSDYPNAERLFRQALAIRRRVLGKEHIEVARSLGNLAHTLNGKGDTQEAEPLFREAIAMHRKVGGNEQLATTLNNFALLLDNTGKYEEAEKLFKESLAMRRKLLGDDHPDVAGGINNLAGLYRRTNALPAAEQLFNESLTIARKSLGAEHPMVATIMNNLAIVLSSMDKKQAAERLYRTSLEIRRKHFGEENIDVATSLNNLGLLLYDGGNYAEAEKLYRQALAIHRKLLGDEHRSVAIDLNNLGILLNSKKDYPAAVDALRESLAVYRKSSGDETIDVARCLGNLGFALYEKGNYEEAEKMARQALEKRRRLLSPEHVEIALSLLSVGRMLSEQGKAQEAEPMIREGVEIRRKVLATGHWQVDEAESVLGGCLAALKRFEEAERLLLKSYAALKTKRPAGDRRIEQAGKRLVKLYSLWGKPDKAAPYR